MKNKLIVTVVMICMAVCILAMALYIILGNNNAVCKVTFDSDGGTEVAEINVMAGLTINEPHTEKEGYIFDGWYLDDELFSFATPVEKDIALKAKWTKISMYTVTYYVREEVFAAETVAAGEKAPYVAAPEIEGYIFTEWQKGGEAWDFDGAVTEDMTLTAVYEFNYAQYIMDICTELTDLRLRLEGEGFGYNYTQENAENICSVYSGAILAIQLAKTEEEADEIYEKAVADMNAVETLRQKLEKHYEELISGEYFPENLAELEEIYLNALDDYDAYEGGIPTPETVVNKAIEAMDAVLTKAENILLAEAEADRKISELNDYVGALDKSLYTEENWISIMTILEEGIAEITANIENGTKAVCEAYERVIDMINAVPEIENT